MNLSVYCLLFGFFPLSSPVESYYFLNWVIYREVKLDATEIGSGVGISINMDIDIRHSSWFPYVLLNCISYISVAIASIIVYWYPSTFDYISSCGCIIFFSNITLDSNNLFKYFHQTMANVHVRCNLNRVCSESPTDTNI